MIHLAELRLTIKPNRGRIISHLAISKHVGYPSRCQFFQLLLGVNEPGARKSLISLDQLQFYTSKVGSQTTSDIGSLGTLRYTFSSGDGVILDALPNYRSGSADMYAYILTSDGVGTGEPRANSRDEHALSIIGFFAVAFAMQHLRRHHTRRLGDM